MGLQVSGLRHIFRCHMIIQRTCGYEQGGANPAFTPMGVDSIDTASILMTPILHCIVRDLKRGKNDISTWGMHIFCKLTCLYMYNA